MVLLTMYYYMCRHFIEFRLPKDLQVPWLHSKKSCCHWLCRKADCFMELSCCFFFRKHKDELTKTTRFVFFQCYFLFLLVHLCVFLRPRKECFPPGKFLSLTFCISTRLASNWDTQKAWLTRFKKILISIARRKKRQPARVHQKITEMRF